VEVKQLDEGIGDTFVLVGVASSLHTRMINPQDAP
jgi:hypothetical protein